MKEKYLKKAFEIFLLFYITFIPLVFFGHANDPFWVVEKFFFRFAISILSCIFLLYMFATKKIFYIKTPYNFLFLAFMCINLIGILKISNFYAFMDRFFENICYLITAYLALLYLLTNRPADKTNEILLLLVSAAGFMAIYGIAQSFGIDFLSWQTNFSNRAASTLGNPNFLAGHMVLIIPLCYAMIFIVQNRVLRFAMLLISVITTTALLFTQTRGAYIGFGVSTIFFLLLLALYARDTLQKYKTWIIVFCCIAAGIVGAYLVKNHNALARIKEIVTLKDESVRIRALLWKNSLYLISENPLLGSGAGNFYAKYPYYQSRALDYTYFTNNDFYRSGHSHNDFIQFAAEYGIPGAGIMFAIFALIFITGFKHLKDSGQNKMLIMGMLSGIAGLLIHAIFNFPFQIIPTTVVFYLFLSMLVFNEKEFSSREPAINGAARIAGAVLLVIFITAGVIAVRALASDSYLRSAKEADYFKQPENAAGYAARAISITPWNEDELYFYGQVLEKQGKKTEAYKSYEQVYKVNKSYWEAMPRVFQYYMEQGMKVKALDLGEEMYKISPYAKKTIIALAYAYYANGKNDDAIKVCEQGIKYYPNDSTLLDQVSGIYGSTGNYDKTLFYAQKAIEAEPGYSEPYYNAALAYFKIKNYREAKKMVDKLLVLEPDSGRGKALLEAIKHAK